MEKINNKIVIFSLLGLIFMSLSSCMLLYLNNSKPVNITINEQIEIVSSQELYEINQIHNVSNIIEISGSILKSESNSETFNIYIALLDDETKKWKVFKTVLNKKKNEQTVVSNNGYKNEIIEIKSKINKVYLHKNKSYKLYILCTNNDQSILVNTDSKVYVQ